MNSSERPNIGAKCVVGKEEELPSMRACASITGGDVFARACGQYNKMQHAEQDKARLNPGAFQVGADPWVLAKM